MNKIIFQLGLLAFFVSIVVFGTQNFSLLEIAARSFIVFIGVVVTASAILAGSAMMAKGANENAKIQTPDPQRGATSRQSQASPSQKAA